MDKMEKVSLQVEPQLKSELEAAARDENTSVAEVVRRASMEYLKKRRKKAESAIDTEEQERLRAKLMKYAGSVSGAGISANNENLRKAFAEKFAEDEKRRNVPRPR